MNIIPGAFGMEFLIVVICAAPCFGGEAIMSTIIALPRKCQHFRFLSLPHCSICRADSDCVVSAMKLKSKLLTRDAFREGVISRDKHRCVICGKPETEDFKLNAHHIIDRALFPDGGYYLDNGAALCEEVCHLAAERTLISVEEVRKAAGIVNPVFPPGFTKDDVVDKWCNIILPNKTRVRGPMFYDEPVQKVLKEAGLLESFTHLVKHPQTKHLDFSQGFGKDDDVLWSLDELDGYECVVTAKMDGESFTMYRDTCHARSLDGRHHDSRNWAKAFHAERRHDIPELWRVTNENLYARHSIGYEDLPSYVLGIFVWNERNIALSWDETLEWFELLRITPVPVIWRGKFTRNKMIEIAESIDTERQEGFVVRRADEIPYGSFGKRVAKWVRKGHVQTEDHWMHAQIVPNGLAR